MKSTVYSRFCRRLFSNTFVRFNFSETSRNRLLEKADISMVYKEYYSMVLMNILLGFMFSFISTVMIYFIIPHQITALLILLVSSLVPLFIGLYYISMPSSKSKSRGKNIDRYLPYATNFINTMSVAGISPAEIFEALSAIKLYGEIQKEATKFTTEINLMRIDTINAIQHELAPFENKLISTSDTLRKMLNLRKID